MRDFERAARGRGGADAVAAVTGEQGQQLSAVNLLVC